MDPTLTRIPPTTVEVPPLADIDPEEPVVPEPVDDWPDDWPEPEPTRRPRSGC